MIYYQEDKILIRDLTTEDAYMITKEEIKQGWHQQVEKYIKRIQDRDNGFCISLVAEYEGNIAGYINIYINSNKESINSQRLPEIVDLGVLEKYRKQGIGTKLMDVAEEIAKTYSSKVFLSVGLHKGYGSAQRMYVKRGYIPDGSGVWYQDEICTPYSNCCNDDDLLIRMYKEFK